MNKLKALLNISNKDKETLKKLDFKAPSVWLATWFGCGFLRPAPGTWGSLGALPPALLLTLLGHPTYLLYGIVIVCLIGFWATTQFERMSQQHDSKMIVIDEVAGQWIALWPVLSAPYINPIFVVLAFLLFRLFDIIKPWPVSYFDKKIKNALGVMGDDIIAGLMAAIVIGGIQYAGFG